MSFQLGNEIDRNETEAKVRNFYFKVVHFWGLKIKDPAQLYWQQYIDKNVSELIETCLNMFGYQSQTSLPPHYLRSTVLNCRDSFV